MKIYRTALHRDDNNPNPKEWDEVQVLDVDHIYKYIDWIRCVKIPLSLEERVSELENKVSQMMPDIN